MMTVKPSVLFKKKKVKTHNVLDFYGNVSLGNNHLPYPVQQLIRLKMMNSLARGGKVTSVIYSF